jgi:HPt (histidine-containing phosphotransfer) domain-containing protein
LAALRRDAHNLKGTGSTFGFSAITLIAHRLENYLESQTSLPQPILSGVQRHVDMLQTIVDAGANPSDAAIERWLGELPAPPSFNPADVELRHVEALLLTSSRMLGRVVARELAACGIRSVMSQSPTEAFALVLRKPPQLVIASATMAELSGIDFLRALGAMTVTARLPVAVLASSSPGELKARGLPDHVAIIHAGEDMADDLAAAITRFGI